MKGLLALAAIALLGMEAHAAELECSGTKEGVREILEKKFGATNTSYLDNLAGWWEGTSGEPVQIHDSGSLALGNYRITVCPVSARKFFFTVNGLFAGGNEGYISISGAGNKVTISGGKKEVQKVNGTYVKVKKPGNV